MPCVGGDAHIAPMGRFEFAKGYRRSGFFCRVDVFDRPLRILWKVPQISESDIEVHDILCVFLDELFSRLDGLAHEDGEDLVGRNGVV